MSKKKQQVIKYAVFKIEPGFAGVCSTKKGISLLVLPREEKEEVMAIIQKHAADYAKASSAELEDDPGHFADLKKDLAGYFNGKPADLEYTIDLSGYTPFQSAVFTAARGIPYGETRSYRWIARKIGNPRGARAAGQALKVNLLPLLVPCHRVIEEGGKIGGFSLGIRWKERLLQLEGVLLT
ncbi:cysteine methyltransferase [Candidatus Desantisbacteria bacterium CG_4_10_14_0_8_um_filter_48_22]|uniref:methylated-DNA--[protein]-cysteine S-methyltransferase n=1 Tax=Candidatus Desantisbacteria bacterium CG_4_10_14_0_8_um_filter_48_22 TaxID=1974543 RepID=A0A2M7SAL1_9BACT|nr:MAG: hypothetical protein AUJ67_06810 [Candidatus Desantisbacteria bacterium CG1_02_49_89]PIV56358.1 MAG: cysteine methyltransferase [Candidatus Desantisbacteria bacterium CG02_land_8_20_14_3_00_49_13]PIZ16531.1 MAG: cysteine methyltransferase [Candidatus Desantisbacteria bacterium CG_4_10_14_0_8_um_filter_48_22]PJB27792.1 MAG: cysteine methyltransferase [Candidatus Desantisbacteria bacterium CG_4_9_14_3_um_filter_50_7]